MKIGMICECAPGGPDVEIGKHFVKMLVAGADFVGRTMTNKAGIRSSFLAAYGTRAQPWDRIVLICIEQMLEAWLLADGTAVVEHVSRPTHKPPRFKEVRRPDQEQDPKSRLINYFRQAGRTYNEHVDAVPIAKRASLSKLRRSESFQRLENKLSQLAQVAPPRRR